MANIIILEQLAPFNTIHSALVFNPEKLKPKHMDIRGSMNYKPIPSLCVLEWDDDGNLKHIRALWNITVEYCEEGVYADDPPMICFPKGEVFKCLGGYLPEVLEEIAKPMFKMSGTKWKIPEEYREDLQIEILKYFANTQDEEELRDLLKEMTAS